VLWVSGSILLAPNDAVKVGIPGVTRNFAGTGRPCRATPVPGTGRSATGGRSSRSGTPGPGLGALSRPLQHRKRARQTGVKPDARVCRYGR
jgi:hypothetical protein